MEDSVSADAERRLKEISAELAVARREVDRLQKDLESVESANARLVEERDEKEARVQALKKRVELVESERHDALKEKKSVEGLLHQFEREKRNAASTQNIELEFETAQLRNENVDLQRQITDLKDEVKTLYRFQDLKTKAIENLTKRVQDYEDLQERFKKLEIVHVTQQEQMPELENEIARLRRALDDATEEASRLMVEASETPALTALKTQKTYVESELKRGNELRSQQERTIRAQQVRIERLQRRLETLAHLKHPHKLREAIESEPSVDPSSIDVSSVTEDSIRQESESEFVPVQLFNKLSAEIQYLNQVLQEKDDLLSQKDASIELQQKKIEVLQKSKESDKRSAQIAYRDLETRLQSSLEEMKTQEVHFKELENSLRRELHRTKGQLHRIREGTTGDSSSLNISLNSPSPVRPQSASSASRPSSASLARCNSSDVRIWERQTAASSAKRK